MKRALCSGSFDPVTNGHIDIFERASRMAEELVVCVFHNRKKQGMFSVEERVRLLREAVGHLPNVRVDAYDGLLPEYLRIHDIHTVIRGLRSASDFEYEWNSAQMLKHLLPEAETVFLLTAPELSFVSSSGVREIVSFRGDVRGLVPECVAQALECRQEGMGTG